MHMTSIIKEPGLKMVAAGAGSRLLQSELTDPILKEALDISGARKPTVLTIATAEPTENYFNEFIEGTERRFGALGANVVNLHAFGKAPSEQEALDKISQADTIWVAGGDTDKMMESWRQYHITEKLNEAAVRGVVMSGGSAGMLAWMEQGHSDSLSYRVPEGEPWDYIFVPGLGYVSATATPHFDEITDGKARSTDFRQKFLANDKLSSTGIGVDNMAALSVTDGKFRVLRAPDADFPRAQVHIMKKNAEGGLTENTLPVSNEYQSLDLS
jgi:dipeptidase E